ncbi:MAG: SDR family NAD(P)-dependent oxidoreductase [Acetivibrionales bacterium]
MTENYREPKIIFEGWTDVPAQALSLPGAASGIGAATAILAAQSELKVAAWDMNVEGIQETIERAGEFGKNIKPVRADLSSDEDVARAMKETLEYCKPQVSCQRSGTQDA